MKFIHGTDPTRTGELTRGTKSGPPSLTLKYVDPKGKARGKTFKSTTRVPALALENVWNKALRFIFAEGFGAPAPQRGPVRWLTATDEPYPHGFPFAIDRAGGHVWVADTGHLRRITRGSLEQIDLDIGDRVRPITITCTATGEVFALLDIADDPQQGTPPWTAPAAGGFSYAVVTVTPDLRVHLIVQVPQPAPRAQIDNLSATEAGRVLGPGPDGAALYAADGQVERRFTAHPTQSGAPKGAISPDGRWVALTAEGGHVRIIDPQGGTALTSEASFSDIHGLAITDQGVALIRGFGPHDWGLYRLDPSGPLTQLSHDLRACVGGGGDTVITCEYGEVSVAPATFDAPPIRCSKLPMLGMKRRGAAQLIDADHVIVRTDAHTLAEVELGKLAKAQRS